MFSRRRRPYLSEMAHDRNFSRIIWIHQFIWRFFPRCIGISKAIAIYWADASCTVYRTGTSPQPRFWRIRELMS
jgi:hypothetical protein